MPSRADYIHVRGEFVSASKDMSLNEARLAAENRWVGRVFGAPVEEGRPPVRFACRPAPLDAFPHCRADDATKRSRARCLLLLARSQVGDGARAPIAQLERAGQKPCRAGCRESAASRRVARLHRPC